jgi:hypothetical protein
MSIKYQYTKPVAEKHEVNWYLREMPGIYGERAKNQFMAHAVLCPELTTWLDANAPGWSFRSDSDYGNTGDDDEGCHLTVSSREEGEGFIEQAKRISDAWTVADRLAMRHRIILETVTDGRIEIHRSHEDWQSVGDHERRLCKHLHFDRQPMRKSIFKAIREAEMQAHHMRDQEEYEIDIGFAAEDLVAEGTRLLIVKVPVVTAPETPN